MPCARLGSTALYVQSPDTAEAELNIARSILCMGATAAMLLGATRVAAGDVTVRIEDLRSGSGSVMVAICTADAFLSMRCRHRAHVKARAGAAEVTVGGVPAGSYAVQAIHDENDNSELDRNLFGLPREGLAISRNAPMRFGPPHFSDAAVEIGEGGGSVTLHMRYF